MLLHPEEKYQFARDLVGYGQEGLQVRWPNGARIAVSFCVNYEEGAELTVLNGDVQSETMNWEKSAGTPFVGARHTNAESDYEYGSRTGIWRLFRLFGKHNFPITCFAVGQALEFNPAVARACIAAGHEVAGHGYRWLDYKGFTAAAEKESVKKGIKAITETTGGVPPKGWFVGRGSPNSVGVVWEAFKESGLEMKWSADAFNDDVPYWVDVPLEEADSKEAKGLLILPYDYHTNDMKFVGVGGIQGVTNWEELLKGAFDTLYEEGGKMMSIGLHPRLTGKPGRAIMLRNFLEYISQKEGVWVATRAQIAEHFEKTHPYKRST